MSFFRVPLFLRLPRLTSFLVLALILIGFIAAVSPVQLPVVVYKLSLISLAAVAGYWLDRALFPYARPDIYLVSNWRCGPCTLPIRYPVVPEYKYEFMVACLRRAVIVLAVIIGVATGL